MKRIFGFMIIMVMVWTWFQAGETVQASGNCFGPDLCFAAPTLTTEFAGTDLAAGYIDGDSNLDFATTSTIQDYVRIMMGCADETWCGMDGGAVGNAPTDVALGDFDNDNQTDIITAGYQAHGVTVLSGSANWDSGEFVATGSSYGPFRLAAGDVNGDGQDDFVSANAGGPGAGITVAYGQLGGGFSVTNFVAGDFGDGAAINLADCDNDGDLDLFYSSDNYVNTSITLRRNNGAGQFKQAAAEKAINVGSSQEDAHVMRMTFADINSDGNLDIIAARKDHKLLRALGTGSCTFQNVVSFSSPLNPRTVQFADLTGDGILDMVAGHQNGDKPLNFYIGDGNGNFTGPYTPTTSAQWVTDVVLDDFNGDAITDVLYLDSGTGVYLMLGQASGSVGNPWISPWALKYNLYNGLDGIIGTRGELTLSDFALPSAKASIATEGSVQSWQANTQISYPTATTGNVSSQFAAVVDGTTVAGLDMVATANGLEISPIAGRVVEMRYLLNGRSVQTTSFPQTSIWDLVWCYMELPKGLPSQLCDIFFEYHQTSTGNTELRLVLPESTRVTDPATGRVMLVDELQVAFSGGTPATALELGGTGLDRIIVHNEATAPVR